MRAFPTLDMRTFLYTSDMRTSLAADVRKFPTSDAWALPASDDDEDGDDDDNDDDYDSIGNVIIYIYIYHA